MTKVIISEDCGNSPKNIFVQELTIAFAKGDSKFILSHTTDDVRSDVIGDQVREGKHDVANAGKENPASELIIHHVATHGKTGMVDGRIKLKSGKIHAFCHVYEFSNTKGTRVKGIISYMIEFNP